MYMYIHVYTCTVLHAYITQLHIHMYDDVSLEFVTSLWVPLYGFLSMGSSLWVFLSGLFSMGSSLLVPFFLSFDMGFSSRVGLSLCFFLYGFFTMVPCSGFLQIPCYGFFSMGFSLWVSRYGFLTMGSSLQSTLCPERVSVSLSHWALHCSGQAHLMLPNHVYRLCSIDMPYHCTAQCDNTHQTTR